MQELFKAKAHIFDEQGRERKNMVKAHGLLVLVS